MRATMGVLHAASPPLLVYLFVVNKLIPSLSVIGAGEGLIGSPFANSIFIREKLAISFSLFLICHQN